MPSAVAGSNCGHIIIIYALRANRVKSSYSDLLGIATNPSGSVLQKKLQSKSKILQ